tara:strand:+ start:1404 stop:1736 length:333 start_codon:yes stop_codon:yes gene_type:complete
MSFFDSEFVRSEMAEIHELQEEIYGNVMQFTFMNNEDKSRHILILEKLIEKQKIMYTRLSLSDDPEAKKMLDEIIKSAAMMGLPQNVDMNIVWKQMTDMVGMMKQQLDIS